MKCSVCGELFFRYQGVPGVVRVGGQAIETTDLLCSHDCAGRIEVDAPEGGCAVAGDSRELLNKLENPHG